MSVAAGVTLELSEWLADPARDSELAACAYSAVRGWPDQRPMTADLVASRLRPQVDERPTLLALARDDGGGIAGWAAVRWGWPGQASKLWGPVVRPGAQGSGVGRALLTAAMAAAEAKRPVSVEAAEVPTGRTAAERLFRSAGWRAARMLTLLKRPVPNDAPTEPQPARPHRRTVSLRDSGLDAAGAAAAIASLYRGLDPGAAAGFAEQTLERWSRDRRFDPAGVLLVFEGPSPVAMALAWPLAHAGPEEEAEVLVTDVAATDVDHAFVLKQAAIHAALARGRDVGARVARAVVRPGEESEPFLRAGFAAVADAVVFRWSPDAEGAA